jgi:predicted transcriptional regulator
MFITDPGGRPRISIARSQNQVQFPDHMRGIFHFRTSSSPLGPLEERLLEALWRRGNPVTVRELVEQDCGDLAYTTVMTTLDRLFKKNLLRRETDGRAFRYSPLYSCEELHQQVLNHTLQRALDATPIPALPLSYLVETLSERDAKLLDDLKELVEAKRRQLAAKGSRNRNSGNNAGKGKA